VFRKNVTTMAEKVVAKMRDVKIDYSIYHTLAENGDILSACWDYHMHGAACKPQFCTVHPFQISEAATGLREG
jgi:hypothetical protein